MENFAEKLPQTLEELASDAKALKSLQEKVGKMANPGEELIKGKLQKIEPDVHGFMEYLMGDEMKGWMAQLLPKATKKKPLSFERLNMIVMPLIQFLETHKPKELAATASLVEKWLDLVVEHQGLNLNTQFET